MNSVLQNMLSKYEIKNTTDETNAMKEIIQEIVLCGLSRGGFFNEAFKWIFKKQRADDYTK